MRPVDLAREHGLSAQAVRNYEDAGALPPAERTGSGYRHYTPLHAQALRAFLALRPGHGHQQAVEILRATHRGDLDAAYRLIDSAHAALTAERRTRSEVAAALDDLSGTPAATASPPLSVGELARRLGLHPATLRTWEAAGILRPERDRATGHRVYGPESVRDAEVARQLRRGHHPLPQVARFVESLRAAGGAGDLAAFLDAWQARLLARGRALLTGAARLDDYLALLERSGQASGGGAVPARTPARRRPPENPAR
ncbi:MerR family transcriptional regulator [Actinokineospora bangkokensis]|uniref:MerR family transcriptional regulator n=1 Tax=Actinokineospora bangkokensis TaxID=1193682 RepID=UPI0009FDCC38|nr:MerR family transcriptional regulator [Actinokineospora bangkokensis]